MTQSTVIQSTVIQRTGIQRTGIQPNMPLDQGRLATRTDKTQSKPIDRDLAETASLHLTSSN